MRPFHRQRSGYSGDSPNCVGTATAPATVRIRDSKTPTGPHLAFPPTAWADFVSLVARPAH